MRDETSTWRRPGVPALLAVLVAGLGPIALVAHMVYAESSQFMSAEVIEARIREYETFGWHRTGGAGDDLTSEWLRAELEDAGVRARLEPVAFPRVRVEHAHVSWPGGQIEGEPLYDGAFTDAGDVRAALAAENSADVAGKIVVADGRPPNDIPFHLPELYALIEGLQARGARGLVIPTGDEHGDIVVRNAYRIDAPLGLPVLQIALRGSGALLEAAASGAEGTLSIVGTRGPGAATNVVAEIPGTDPDAKPLVLMTPKSGWFTCAGERGGGIAIWLGVAKAIAAGDPPRRSLWLLASTGHELDHYGLKRQLEDPAFAPALATHWIHLGANIGVREGRGLLGGSNFDVLESARAELEGAGAGPFDTRSAGEAGLGEARNIAEGGGRFLSLVGTARYFHTPNDTVDRSVDPRSVSRYGEGVLRLVRRLLR